MGELAVSPRVSGPLVVTTHHAPNAARVFRRETDVVTLAIDSATDPVNPAEAQRPVNRFEPRDVEAHQQLAFSIVVLSSQLLQAAGVAKNAGSMSARFSSSFFLLCSHKMFSERDNSARL
jgi:hypothetical protein